MEVESGLLSYRKQNNGKQIGNVTERSNNYWKIIYWRYIILQRNQQWSLYPNWQSPELHQLGSDKGNGTTSIPRRRPLIRSHANYVLLSDHPSRLMTDISIITTNVRLGWPSESPPGPLPAKRGSFMANRHDIRALQKAVMCLISLLPPSRQLSSREQSQAEPGRNR